MLSVKPRLPLSVPQQASGFREWGLSAAMPMLSTTVPTCCCLLCLRRNYYSENFAGPFGIAVFPFCPQMKYRLIDFLFSLFYLFLRAKILFLIPRVHRCFPLRNYLSQNIQNTIEIEPVGNFDQKDVMLFT